MNLYCSVIFVYIYKNKIANYSPTIWTINTKESYGTSVLWGSNICERTLIPDGICCTGEQKAISLKSFRKKKEERDFVK